MQQFHMRLLRPARVQERLPDIFHNILRLRHGLMFADECEFTQADPQTHVRALTDPGQAISIILDSGADGSVLPLSYANIGRSDKSSAVGQPQVCRCTRERARRACLATLF